MQKIFLLGLLALGLGACRRLPPIGTPPPSPSEDRANSAARRAATPANDYQLDDIRGNGQSLYFFNDNKPDLLLQALQQVVKIEREQNHCAELQVLNIRRASASEDGFEEHWHLQACGQDHIYQVLFQADSQGRFVPLVTAAEHQE